MKKLVLTLPFCALACIQPGGGGPKGVTDAGPDAVPGAEGLAVVSGDSQYQSSLVSLVGAPGTALVQDDCLDSGDTIPGASLALSGDVVLPSQSQPGDDLILIDQGNAALVWLNPSNCTVTHDLSVATGFMSNPQDVAGVSPTKAYVSRYATNPNPSGAAGANDQGDDLLIIDPSTQTITGRIDMSSWAIQEVVQPGQPDAGPIETIQAAPERAVLANDLVYVTLNDISGDFSTVGPARIVIVDPSTDTVAGTIDPPGIKNCNNLSFVPAAQELLVACDGDFNQAPTTQVAQSAVLVYDISGSSPSLLQTISGTAMGNQPVMNYLLAGISGEYAVAATLGNGSTMPATPDALWNLNLQTGAATLIETADGYLTLGSAVYVPKANKVLITDGSTTNPRVAVYSVANPASPTLAGSFDADPKAGLLPRAMAWY